MLKSVSPSQIENYVSCPRKWFHRSVLKTEVGEERPWLSAGTASHKAFEHYSETGEIKRDEYFGLMQAAKDFLPPPKTALVEHWINMPTYSGGPLFRGKPDLIVPPSVEPIVWIPDLKNTSDFKWCKTEEDLPRHIQLMSYAKWGMDTYRVDRARLSLVYLNRNKVFIPECEHVESKIKQKGNVRYWTCPDCDVKAKAKQVECYVTREEVEFFWRTLLGYVREMVDLSEKGVEDAQQLIGKSCEMYRGCDYLRQCGLYSPFVGMEGYIVGNQKSLLELLLDADTPERNKEIKERFAIIPPDAPSRETPAGDGKKKRKRKAEPVIHCKTCKCEE